MAKKEIFCRLDAGTGTWLSTLLPVAVVLGAYKFPNSSTNYLNLGIFSLGLLATQAVVACIHTTFPYTLKSSRKLNNYLILPLCLTASLLYMNSCQLSYGIFAGFLSTYAYTYGVANLLAACPRSLTYGEASIVTQTILTFSFSLMNNVHYVWHFTPSESTAISTVILQMGLLGIGILCGMAFYIPLIRSTLPFYATSVAILVCTVVPLLHVLLQTSPLLWIIEFVFHDWARIGLVTFWATCCGVAVVAVTSQIEGQRKASTVIRKYFHVLAIVVFIPGIVGDISFLYLASGVIFGLFIVLETLRLLQLPPLGKYLHDGFSVFADNKDQGGLSLTPMYLFAGCSLPMWLHPELDPEKHVLTLLAGVLSIGIGDSAASVFGTWFGKHKWSDASRKSVEGSIACALSQVCAILLIINFVHLPVDTFGWLQIIVAIFATTIAEAITDQVDNLVLPFIMYILLL